MEGTEENAILVSFSESFCLFVFYFHPSPLPSFPSRVCFLLQCLELILTLMVPDLCKQSLPG